MATYDDIVVGLGAMGSAAAWHLARRGRRVLGVDAFEPGHRHGSSHGYTRIIRKAYFEDPAYVPLLERAYTLWEELARGTGEPLMRITGGLMLGRPESAVVAGALLSARRHGLPHEVLTPSDVRRRFPAFTPEPGLVGLWEPQAGILFPERCIRAHQRAAAQAGADLRHGEPVRSWRDEGSRVAVETSRGRYEAGGLVVTAGPWTSALLAGMGLPLAVTRQPVCWFDPASPEEGRLLSPDRCPVFIAALDGVAFYGIPCIEGWGFKAAIHETGEVSTPETVRPEVEPGEVEAVRRLLRRVVPAAGGRVRETMTCLYTMTPDGQFIVGRDPQAPRLVYAAGFSGHGFKFAGVIGEILADLAIEGSTAHPIAFLSPARFPGVRSGAQA